MRGVGAVLLAVAALCVVDPALAADSNRFAGHRYVLTRVDGAPFEAGREVEMQFGDDWKITGRICNTFTGQATYERGVLTAGNLATTRMLCTNSDLSRIEKDLLRALRDGVGMLAVGDDLELRRDASSWFFERKEQAQSTDAAEPEAGAVEERQLVGRKFILKEMDGEAFSVEAQRQPFVEFSLPEEGLRINGSACNTFMGPATLSGGTLTVTRAAATMMMCVDPKLSTFERDFHRMLRDGVTVELDGGTLVLRGDGKTLTYAEE